MKPNLANFDIQDPAAKPDAKPASKPRKMKAFRIRTEAVRELAMLKAETGASEQDLIGEAINLLFSRYGRPPVA